MDPTVKRSFFFRILLFWYFSDGVCPGARFQPFSRPGHHQRRRRLETGGVLEKNTGIIIIW